MTLTLIRRVNLRLGSAGAIVCDMPIKGAQRLHGERAVFYGGVYFLCESVNKAGLELIISAIHALPDEAVLINEPTQTANQP